MKQPNGKSQLVVGWGYSIVAGLIVLSGLAGCGKKAPPIPPHHQPLSQVTELKGSLQGDMVTLLWRSVGREKITSFEVFRAQSETVQAECQGCPRIFQKVGTATLGQDDDHYVFSESVASGFVYIYKVQPVGTPGDRGPESNVVVIDRTSAPVER